MNRSHLALATAIVLCGPVAAQADAATLCVGERPGCFAGLQDAVDSAHDGDAIDVGPGVYRGGVTIDVSVELRGAGADATRISGGGPVLTIGKPLAPDPPTVAISGVTISDGVTTAFRGPQAAFGGGVLIPPSEDSGPGATVTISNSVIERNVASPSETVPSNNAECPDGPCPFANGSGGGIFNAGSLTLTRTTVARNRAGTSPSAPALASDAEGGGIFSDGPLTLIDSQVVANEAHALPPNARFADGGGVFSRSGGVTIRGSTIADNRAILESAWPASVEQLAIAGGLHIADTSHATIEHATIEDNGLSASNAIGDAIAFGGGMHADGPVVMRDSSVSGNRVQASTRNGGGFASADSGAGDFTAATTIAGSRFADNRATALARGGSALAAAGALFPAAGDGVDLANSLIVGNVVTARSEGEVTARGGGVENGATLAMRETQVAQNAVRAFGRSGTASGGGMWSGRLPDLGDPRLTVSDSAITANVITAGPGIAAGGGGLFTTEPATLTRVRIQSNRPDQCVGC